jgi:hypothetical protein
MSQSELDRLIGTALADPRVCSHLLNSRRQEVIAVFDLTAEEQTVLMQIQADTLQEFAQALLQWMDLQTESPPIRLQRGPADNRDQVPGRAGPSLITTSKRVLSLAKTN